MQCEFFLEQLNFIQSLTTFQCHILRSLLFRSIYLYHYTTHDQISIIIIIIIIIITFSMPTLSQTPFLITKLTGSNHINSQSLAFFFLSLNTHPRIHHTDSLRFYLLLHRAPHPGKVENKSRLGSIHCQST